MTDVWEMWSMCNDERSQTNARQMVLNSLNRWRRKRDLDPVDFDAIAWRQEEKRGFPGIVGTFPSLCSNCGRHEIQKHDVGGGSNVLVCPEVPPGVLQFSSNGDQLVNPEVVEDANFEATKADNDAWKGKRDAVCRLGAVIDDVINNTRTSECKVCGQMGYNFSADLDSYQHVGDFALTHEFVPKVALKPLLDVFMDLREGKE